MLEAELRFSGKVTNGALTGTIEGFQAGSRIATGIWSAARQQAASESGLAGRWVGSFIIQAGSQPQARRLELIASAPAGKPAYIAPTSKALRERQYADTSTGRYKPFADLISNDGYLVVPNKEKFSKSTLAGVEVLAIVNASGPQEQRGSSAFSREEGEVVRAWVNGGGALLLITDHAPFSEAAAGSIFSMLTLPGHYVDAFHHNTEPKIRRACITRYDGLLVDHRNSSRDASERHNRYHFHGSIIKCPQGRGYLSKADRLMDVCGPGEGLVADETALSIHRCLPWRDQGARELRKGGGSE